MSTQGGSPSLLPLASVEGFVLRARRVAAHSLAQSPDELRRRARSLFSVSVDLSGNLTLDENLPDEETFESLVARLRPLTVPTESIFYGRVLDAVTTLLGPGATAQELEQIADLRRRWLGTEIQGTQAQGYTAQTMHPDTGATPEVSDTQLAAGWLYADLVHADARGPKAESLAFTIKDRFTAAVRIFSQVAVLTMETLDFVRRLYDTSRLQLSDAPWSQEVTSTGSDVPRDVRIYHADVGTSAPEFGTSMRDAPGTWAPLTVADLLWQDSANRAAAALHTGCGVEVVDAVVLQRRSDESSAQWDVLVGGCAIFSFAFSLDDRRAVACTLTSQNFLDLTNTLKFESTRLARRLREARSVEFSLPTAGP